MLGYLIPLLLFLAAYFAIRHFSRTGGRDGVPTLSRNAAKWLYIVLGVLVALTFLSMLGVCPGVNEQTGLDPLLNRTPR